MEDYYMSYECELKKQPTRPAISIRMRVSLKELYQLLGRIFEQLFQYISESGAIPVGPPFEAYYDMDLQNLDVELGVPVSKKLPDKGEIKYSEIPGGNMATCLYVPWEAVEPPYDVLKKWIKKNGYEDTGVVYVMYLDGLHADPEKRREIIEIPLKMKKE